MQNCGIDPDLNFSVKNHSNNALKRTVVCIDQIPTNNKSELNQFLFSIFFDLFLIYFIRDTDKLSKLGAEKE